jgi:hypothetical protein
MCRIWGVTAKNRMSLKLKLLPSSWDLYVRKSLCSKKQNLLNSVCRGKTCIRKSFQVANSPKCEILFHVFDFRKIDYSIVDPDVHIIESPYEIE